MARYIACTLQGDVIYSADTAQKISDAYIKHAENGLTPSLAYTFDQTQGYVYPFVTWAKESIGWCGSPWKTFNDVLRVWG